MIARHSARRTKLISCPIRPTETTAEEALEEEVEAGEGAEPREAELDPETAARRKAALAQIRQFGDPVLRTRARPIERFDDALREEIEQMGTLMDDAIGVGLAATQVGVVHRLLVYRVQQDAQLAALINPELEWSGRETESMEEGCLSLPRVLVEVDGRSTCASAPSTSTASPS